MVSYKKWYFLPIEKILILMHVIILIKLALDKVQNHYYCKIFLENVHINYLKVMCFFYSKIMREDLERQK